MLINRKKRGRRRSCSGHYSEFCSKSGKDNYSASGTGVNSQHGSGSPYDNRVGSACGVESYSYSNIKEQND